VHDHQNYEQDGKVQMDVAPLVAAHREQFLYVSVAISAVQCPATSSGTGRQNELDNETGDRKAQKVQKGNEVDNEVYGTAFHNGNPGKMLLAHDNRPCKR